MSQEDGYKSRMPQYCKECKLNYPDIESYSLHLDLSSRHNPDSVLKKEAGYWPYSPIHEKD